MPLLKLKVKGKLTYIPTREIVEVTQENGTVTVYMRNGITYRTSDLDAVLKPLQQEDTLLPGGSVFEKIFGRTP